MYDINFITGTIISAAMRIHTALGPGMMESVYEVVLERDLARLGFKVERQKWISFEFEGMIFQDAFRLDLLVEDSVIVEVKAKERIIPVHEKQLQSYLRLCNCRAGLLLNFNEALLKNGIRRIVNRLPEATLRTPLPSVPRVK